MRAQISFEFMLYLTVAMLAFSVSLSFVASYYSKESASSYSYEVAQFVSAINNNMLYSTSTFYAYIPHAICNLSYNLINHTLSSKYHNVLYRFNNPVKISNSICLTSGKVEKVRLWYTGNGAYNLDVV